MGSTKKLLLTPKVIADSLEDANCQFSVRNCNDSARLEGIRFFPQRGEQPLSNSFLYLCTEQPDAEHPFLTEGGTLVVFGRPDWEHINHGCCVFEMEKALDLYHIYDIINDAFIFYHDWDMRICKLAAEGNLEELCKVGREVFQNPISVHDNHFNYYVNQCCVGSTQIPTVNSRTGRKMISAEILEQMSHSQAFHDTLNVHGAHLYWDFPRLKYRMMYVNLFDSNDEYFARCMYDEIGTSARPGHFYLLEYFGECVKVALQSTTSTLAQNTTIVDQIILRLLHNYTLETSSITAALQQIDWEIDHEYALVYLETDSVNQHLSMAAIGQNIENEIDASVAVPYGDGVAMMVNLSRLKNGNEADFISLLRKPYLRGFCIGVSVPFSDFTTMPIYYKQAVAAIRLAEQAGKSAEQPHFFREWIVDYILEYGQTEIPYRHLISPVLETLKKYDGQQATEYYKTLSFFLEEGGNVAAAAARLFIHRTTMNYRINKIADITGVNLENHNERMYLTLSYLMERNMERTHKNNGQNPKK